MKKATNISVDGLLFLCRRRPTLPHTFACSTIGPAGLNFRVRDGNGCDPRGTGTDKLEALRGRLSPLPKSRARKAVEGSHAKPVHRAATQQSPRQRPPTGPTR